MEQKTVERTNKYGFIDHVLVDEYDEYELSNNGNPIPVCPQCHAMVYPNTGGGCLCGDCAHDFDVECQRDYDEGMLG